MSVHFYTGGGGGSTIEVASTETLAAGSLARVENIGDTNAAKLKFFIPQGLQGAQGPQGPIGTAGNIKAELIFNGDARYAGSGYGLSRGINSFQLLIIEASSSSSGVGNYTNKHSNIIFVNSIAINTPYQILAYLHLFNDSTRTLLNFSFTSQTQFRIDVVVLATNFSRVGIDRIWGVY